MKYDYIHSYIHVSERGTNDNSAWEIDNAYGLYKYLYANFKK